MIRVFVVIALLVPAIVVIVVGVRAQLRKADVCATHSAAASLWAGFERSGAPHMPASDWKLLNDSEYESAVTALVDAGVSLDACPHCYTANGGFADAWGNRFEVAIHKTPNRTGEFIVLSKGPDEILGTNDDIVVPENEQAAIDTIYNLVANRTVQKVVPSEK